MSPSILSAGQGLSIGICQKKKVEHQILATVGIKVTSHYTSVHLPDSPCIYVQYMNISACVPACLLPAADGLVYLTGECIPCACGV